MAARKTKKKKASARVRGASKSRTVRKASPSRAKKKAARRSTKATSRKAKKKTSRAKPAAKRTSTARVKAKKASRVKTKAKAPARAKKKASRTKTKAAVKKTTARVAKKASKAAKKSSRRTAAKTAAPKAKAATRKASARRTTKKKATARPATKKAASRPSRRALNTFRLGTSVLPLGYTLALDVDPARGRDYSGIVQIDLDVREPTRHIELHAADLTFGEARVEYGFRSAIDDDATEEGVDAPNETTIGTDEVDETSPASDPVDSDGSPDSVQYRTTQSHPAILDVVSSTSDSAPLEAAASAGGAAVGLEAETVAPEMVPVAESTPTEAALVAAPSATEEPADGADGFVIEIAQEAEDETYILDDSDLQLDEPEFTQVGKTNLFSDKETVVVELKDEVPVGTATLTLEFTGQLRDDLRGLYAARSGEHAFAFTQLEAVDARRFFPCFDEPHLKTPLQLSLQTSADHEVVSNSPIETVQFTENGSKTVHFAPTQPLPTYLYALAVGPLESSEPRVLGDTEIRTWHVPGKAHLVNFGLDAALESLTRLEGYFDIAYPYEKLDLVAVPDFEIGAMENAGAVFFRETLLLLDPDSATLDELRFAAEVIAHELAHMWFGDLVTMEWWDDLWLKESFATWMSISVIDDWKPDWRMWQSFQHDRRVAMDLDSLENTHSIYTEVKSPEQATEHFDAITYRKGASVVRMIEGHLGSLLFRDGIRLYMRKHAGGTARAEHLWEALSEASEQPVSGIVKAWIETEGHPLVRTRVNTKGDKTTLVVTQERFLEKPTSGKPAKVSGRWPVPFGVKLGLADQDEPSVERQVLERVRTVMDLAGAPHFHYANADESGVYRVLPDRKDLDALLDHKEHLNDVERAGLATHLWAGFRSGHTDLRDVLTLIEAFHDETDPDVLAVIATALDELSDIAEGAGRDAPSRFRQRLTSLYADSMIELGWEGGSDEPLGTSLRRAQVFSILAKTARWEPVVARSLASFEAYQHDRSSLDPNLADTVVRVAARHADATRYDELLHSYEQGETPQVRQRFLLALAQVENAKLMRRTLDLTLTDVIPTQDVARVLIQGLKNGAASEATWSFICSKWKKVSKRLTPSLVSRVVDATPALPAKSRSDVARFFKEHPVPTAERAVKQAMERFSIRQAMRRRGAPVLRTWLER